MKFERDYFINSKTSNYKDYREKNYDRLASEIIQDAKIEDSDFVLDYGCATGILVNAFRIQGVPFTFGTDISYWAITYGKDKYQDNSLDYLTVQYLNDDSFSTVLFLDVLEHIEIDELKEMFKILKIPKIIARIPVTEKTGNNYELEVHRKDQTHQLARTKPWWNEFLEFYGYKSTHIFHRDSIYETRGVMCRIYERK